MTRDEIVIGAAGPFSGPQASYGAQIQRAVEYAVAEVNRSGGLLGRSLKVQLLDDTGVADQARVCAQGLVDMGAAAIIGHYLSDCSLAALPIYAKAGVLQIAPSTTTPAFTDIAAQNGWTTVLRTCGRDDKQGAVAASFIAQNYKGARIAIVHNGLPYGMGLADVVRSNLRGCDVTVADTAYPHLGSSVSDCSTIVTLLLREDIEFVYAGGYYTNVGPFLRAARAAGFQGVVMSGGANANQGLYALAADASDGLLITCRPDARLAFEARAAVEALRSGGFEPEGYTLSAVAAVEVWASAVRMAGTTQPLSVAEAMREMTFSTSYGKLSFDRRGDVDDPLYAIHRWQGGTYTELPM
jgi:branched-chain amino acid transport system substrate-binding protein